MTTPLDKLVIGHAAARWFPRKTLRELAGESVRGPGRLMKCQGCGVEGHENECRWIQFGTGKGRAGCADWCLYCYEKLRIVMGVS
jgi:hypothetical protein